MNKAFKAELGPQRCQPHNDPKLAFGHHTGDTMDPPYNADLTLDKLSIDPESAPLCSFHDTKDPANDADLAVHIAHPTDPFSQTMNTNTGPAPV